MDHQEKKVIQRSSQDYQHISLTFHEAGHSICGLLNLIKINEVSVSPSDPEDIGSTAYDLYELSQDEKIIEKVALSEIKLYYAGLISEKIYYKDICGSDRFPMTLKRGCSDDSKKATSLIQKHNLAPAGEVRSQFKRKLTKNIRLQLEEHWDAVKLIAHALYAHKKLSYDDLKSLLTKKTQMEHRDFWKEQFRSLKLLFDLERPIDIEEARLILLS